MNAVVMADGWMKGGAEGARRGLADFWTAIGKQLPKEFISHGESDAIDLTSSGKWLAAWAAFFSPSQLNPFDLNPLRELLKNQVDFDGLRAFSPFKFFIGTTQAKSGKLRVLLEDELRLDALLASACLPKIHHAIEIDGGRIGTAGTRRILLCTHCSTSATRATCCWCCSRRSSTRAHCSASRRSNHASLSWRSVPTSQGWRRLLRPARGHARRGCRPRLGPVRPPAGNVNSARTSVAARVPLLTRLTA